MASVNRRRFVWGIGASALAIALPRVALAAGEGALDFARSLYSLKEYWSDITRDEITTALYLDPNLAALVKANYAKDDFDSALDYDPLVQAQDWDEIVTHFKVLAEGDKNADVSVTIENQGQETTITLKLTKTADGWRLSDIASADEPSLVDELMKLNAAQPSDP